MSDRFPKIPEKDLSEAQRNIIYSRLPTDIIWKNDKGQILGPYQPLFYTEDVSDEWYKLAFAVTRQKRLDMREKELCILAVLAEYNVPYILYAHSSIAVRLGFTEAQVQAAVNGTLTAGLNERESAVYSLALKLASLHHPMDDETFEQARRALERDEIAGVAHIVSGYIYVAMLSNLSNLGIPEERAGVFVATKSAALHRQEEGL